MAKKIQKTVGKKAAWATLRLSINGLLTKAQVKPFRSVTLLSAGALVGVMVGGTAGWLAGRNNNGSS